MIIPYRKYFIRIIDVSVSCVIGYQLIHVNCDNDYTYL